jgi:hypothetical protein
MGKIYRTASGKSLDIEALARANDETIAVGNAGLNARGDQVGSGGTIRKTRAQRMREIYADPAEATETVKTIKR